MGQLIATNCDLFSSYMTACIIPSENREDLKDCILQLITPIRHHHEVTVRVDRATAFKSLVKNAHNNLEKKSKLKWLTVSTKTRIVK